VVILFANSGFCSDKEFLWTTLTIQNDLRDDDMKHFDEAFDRQTIEIINQKQVVPIIKWKKEPLLKLLDSNTLFATLYFDSVKSYELTKEEKDILKEYFKRGGFLVLYEDTFPYEQEEFRKKRSLPVFDYLLSDLPKEDPSFAVKKAADSHQLFRVFYKITTSASILEEERENVNYRGHQMLTYKDRISAFVRGRYSYRDQKQKRWIPMRKPYDRYVSDKICDELSVNLIIYVMTH
jgi:hypothetical protein